MSKYDQYKETVLNYSRMMLTKGYTAGTGGNVSMLVKDERVIAITPSDKEYMELTPDDICIVNYNLSLVEGRFNPSRETGMHIAVYKNRPDANAVIHSHQTFASVFALINKPVPAIFDEAVMGIGNVIDVIHYALSGSDELIKYVAAKLTNRCNCYIMQNHGALSIGTSMNKTFRNMELMEKCAQTYYYALSTGEKITALPSDTTEFLFQLLKAEQDDEIKRKRNRSLT